MPHAMRAIEYPDQPALFAKLSPALHCGIAKVLAQQAILPRRFELG
jgi:hypothetical protein